MNKLFALLAVAALAGTAACEKKESQAAPIEAEPTTGAVAPADPAAPVVVDPSAPAVTPPAVTDDSLMATTPIPAESAAARP